MAESADRSNLTERYTAIEQAYCADQWGAVIDQGQDLLREIPRSSGPVPEGLKERVQLLMAHAHLYGFNEQDVAEDLYSAVLHSRAEVALRQIAEQGLQQCSGPRQQPGAGELQANDDLEPTPGPAPAASPAVSSAAAAGEGESAEASSALSRAADSSAELQATTGAEAVQVPAASEPAAISGAEARGSTVASATPAPGNGAVIAPAPAEPAATSSLAMPWLVAGSALAATSASPEASSAPTPWATSPTSMPTAATPPAVETPAAAPLQERSTQETTLIPEVVEEPELFEVHQADPNLAEELDLTVLEPEASVDGSASLEATATPASAAAQASSAAAGPAAMERPGILERQNAQTSETALEEAESSPWQQPITAPGSAPSKLSLAKDTDDLSVEMEPICDLFRNPPAPVEEEDQELLLGLLRVLVSADSAGDGG